MSKHGKCSSTFYEERFQYNFQPFVSHKPFKIEWKRDVSPKGKQEHEEYVAKKSKLCESIFQFLWPCFIYGEQSRNIIKLS